MWYIICVEKAPQIKHISRPAVVNGHGPCRCAGIHAMRPVQAVSISIGAVVCSAPEYDIDRVIAAADSRLYEDKKEWHGPDWP